MKTNQIFKKPIPISILMDFLEKYAIKHNSKYYLVTKDTFKRANFFNDIESLCSNIVDYYYKCKQFYPNRTQTYKTFTTLIRQICRYNHIPFTSKIKYDKSKYEIQYYIYIPLEEISSN